MTTVDMTFDVHFARGRRGRHHLRPGPKPAPSPIVGRVPRVARLLALAIKLDGLIAAGEIKDYAELARIGRVTRARVSQVMGLLNLCPDLQETVLGLPPVERGHDPLGERDLRDIVAILDWREQRAAWRAMMRRKNLESKEKAGQGWPT